MHTSLSVVPAPKTARARTTDVVLWTIAVVFFVQGAVWRWVDVFYIQRPDSSLTSDMGTYYGHALWWASALTNPNTPKQTIADLSRPPGPEMFYGTLYWLDRTWTTAWVILVLMSAAVPLLAGAIGYELYGLRTGLVASSITSLYFPIIHYACFYLSEPLIIFFIPLSIWLLIRSIRVVGTRWAAPIGLAAGLSLGATIATKPAIVGPALFVFLYLLAVACWHLIAQRHGTASKFIGQRLLLVLGTSSAALILFLIPFSIRATRLNEGNFCILAKNGAHNVLMGHHGHHCMYNFHDRKRGYRLGWGNPADCCAGYTAQQNFDFGPYEYDKVLDKAGEWIRQNPGFALELSLRSVGRIFRDAGPPVVDDKWWLRTGDSFALSKQGVGRYFPSTTAFPFSHSGGVGWAVDFYNWLYLFLILPPAVFYVLHNTLSRLYQGKGPQVGDMLLTLPLLATMAVTFCTLGETRTRYPYDALIIVLAAQFYVLAATWLVDRWRSGFRLASTETLARSASEGFPKQEESLAGASG